MTSSSTEVPYSASQTSGYSKVEGSEMDSISETMASLMTFAMSGDNHDMVSYFIGEIQDTMRITIVLLAFLKLMEPAVRL